MEKKVTFSDTNETYVIEKTDLKNHEDVYKRLETQWSDILNPTEQYDTVGADSDSDSDFLPDEEKYKDEDAFYNFKLLNTFVMYYNLKYPSEKNKSMFDDFKEESITNHQMEMFYEMLFLYNSQVKMDEPSTMVYNYSKYKKDMESVENLYGLKVKNVIEYVSEYEFSLLLCVVDKYYDSEWTIFKIK